MGGFQIIPAENVEQQRIEGNRRSGQAIWFTLRLRPLQPLPRIANPLV